MLVRAAAGVEVYLLRRSARSRFVPDVYVFPGGAVDADDSSEAALGRLVGGGGDPGSALRFTALRELFEEAGVLLSCTQAGTPQALPHDGPRGSDALRATIAGGASLAEELARDDRYLDGAALHYYSRWVTPVVEPRRFDTHFFVARAPDDAQASADAYETHDGHWVAPREALARADRGELAIIFPTRKHLERLAAFDSIEALLAHARGRTIVAVHAEERPDGTFGIPGDRDDW